MYDVEVVLPCYNPLKGWAQEIWENMIAIQEKHPELSMGCIVVNDGSTTGFTTEDMEFLIAHVPGCKVFGYTQNRGKGYAVRYGIERSEAPHILYTDIDFPFDISSMRRMLEIQLSGVDIVIGRRLKSYDQQLRFFRKMLSYSSHVINKLILGLPYSDTQGGLKCFNAKGKKIMMQTRIDRYLFDTEFILLASKTADISIQELPIETRLDIQLRKMGIKTLIKEINGMVRLFYIKFFQ